MRGEGRGERGEEGIFRMCTLSWLPLPDGYFLAMNRDELLSRARGIPPSLHESNGVRVIYPSDGDAGGSWLAANELGHSLALLNRFEDTPHVEGGEYRSRGCLLLELAATR